MSAHQYGCIEKAKSLTDIIVEICLNCFRFKIIGNS